MVEGKNLIELKNDKDTVFVGDTHGDAETSKRIINSYPLGDYRIIFLGDYVDRGKQSKENIDYLLKKKKEHSGNLILLMGNHEFPYIEFNPMDFWKSLNEEEKSFYSKNVYELPLAVSIEGIIALHGALPKLDNVWQINELNKIEEDKKFFSMIWGDYIDQPGGFLGDDEGRLQFGKDWFSDSMNEIGKDVLIRGHDRHVPVTMYNDRCITLFTTDSYNKPARIIPKRVTILKKGKSAKDLEVKYL